MRTDLLAGLLVLLAASACSGGSNDDAASAGDSPAEGASDPGAPGGDGPEGDGPGGPDEEVDEPFVPGSKFASKPAAWAVPAEGGFVDGGFSQVAANRWATMDIDGDKRPDLVVAGDISGGDARVWGHGANPHWRVFLNVP